MRIGEFARLTGVPVPDLRHLESLGLLVPGGRDRNGYRRYAVEQVTAATHLHSLVAAGLPAPLVRDLVSALEDPSHDAATRQRRLAALTAYTQALRSDPALPLLDLPAEVAAAWRAPTSRG
jgi:DNA-binding transcriptional MerR regulator